MTRIQILVLVLILVFGWLLLNFKLTEVPPGINGDEAHIAYNAMLVMKTGHDQNNKFLPIFISSFGQKDWKQPITFYSAVLGFKLFGLSYEIFKQVNVVFALIGGFLMFLLVKEILGIKMGFVGLILYMTTPIIFIQSHLMLENIAPVPFVIFWLLMLVKYQKTRRLSLLFLSGLCLGASIYSYLGMRLIVPILAILSLIYIIYISFVESKDKKDSAIVASSVFILSLVPILIITIILKNQYPGAILAENRPQSIKSYQEFLLPYLSSYDFSFLFITGDSTPYHSTGKHGIFLLATLPLFLLGTFSAFVRRKLFLIFVILIFFLTPLLYGFVSSVHRGSRLLTLVPVYILISTLGFNLIASLKAKIIKNFVVGLIVIIIVLNFYDFVTDYWFSYSQRVKSYFPSSSHLTFRLLSEQSIKLNRKPVIQRDIYESEGTTAEFFREVYFPDSLIIKKVEDDIPSESIFLISTDKLEGLEKRNFVKLDITIPGYYFVVN